MNLRRSLFFTFIFLLESLNAQVLQWELFSPIGDYEPYDLGMAVKEDIEGNIYTASYFEDSISVIDSFLYTEKYVKDLIITKYNVKREVEWFKEIDLDFQQQYLGFDLDNNGDLLIASSMHDTLQFDTFRILPEVEKSGFIAKINKDGNTEWVKKIFDGYPTIHSLQVSDNQDILIAGVSWYGGFFARLDSLGNTIWKKEIISPGGGNNEWGSDIVKAANGNIYGVLMFQSDSIGVSEDLILTNPYNWGIQIVLLKFDLDGRILGFSQNTQGKFSEDAKIVLNRDSDVFLMGNFYSISLQLGDLVLDGPVSSNVFGFISKCDSDLNWEWLTQRDPWPSLSYNLALDCQNNLLFIAGRTSLDVFDDSGFLTNQLLFQDNNTICYSLEIGRDNNILIGGVSTTPLGGGTVNDWYNPFLASLTYNFNISNIGCDAIVFPDCIDTILLDHSFLVDDPHQSLFKAGKSIEISGKVTGYNKEKLFLNAGDEINLLPGFEVQNTAEIEINPKNYCLPLFKTQGSKR